MYKVLIAAFIFTVLLNQSDGDILDRLTSTYRSIKNGAVRSYFKVISKFLVGPKKVQYVTKLKVVPVKSNTSITTYSSTENVPTNTESIPTVTENIPTDTENIPTEYGMEAMAHTIRNDISHTYERPTEIDKPSNAIDTENNGLSYGGDEWVA